MTEDISSELGSASTVRNKIVFVGDINVGKTSVMIRFIDNKFKDQYEATVGVDFFSKNLNFKGKSMMLQIWDSAGQERYKSLIPSYVRGASIIFIVFDLSKKETFLNVNNWVNFIRTIKTENTFMILCGNKCDLERQVTKSEGEILADKENMLYFEISAKNNINIKKMFFSALVELPFFQSFNKSKEELIKELEEDNKDFVSTAMDESSLGNIPEKNLNVKDQDEKRNGKCKC